MLYIFDKNEQLAAILANEADACPYTDAVHLEKLNQENTFSFSIPADRPEAAFVKEGAFVAFRDQDLYWQMFEIQKVTDTHNESGVIRQVYAEHVFYELLNDIIEDVRPYNTTAQAALMAALTNTRWQPGTVYDFGTNSVNFYYESVLSALQKIVNTWGGELRFRIEITENAITARYVDILDRRGEDTGKSFEYTKDIVEIQREVDISTVYTAAYGRGKGEEIETEEGTSYTRRITFADVVWSTANGDPVDKPAGQEWVGDPDALAQWGRNGRHRFGIYLDSDETDPAALLQKTWEYVQERKNPLITYSLSVLDLERLSGYNHEAVRLGDTVYIRDIDLGLDVTARVIEIDRDLLLPENTKIVLGNFRPNIADDAVIQAQINRTVSDRQGVWDRATAFGANGKLSTKWLEGIINTLQNQVNAGAGTVTITDDNGILIVDNAENPTAALRLLGGVFAIANTKNPDGTWNWRTFGTGSGFVADEINSGKIRTALVNIFGDTNFYWDADGIKAVNPSNGNMWIKFNKDGLFFTKDNGATYDFSISWSGLYLGTITKEQLSQEVQEAINKKPVVIDEFTTAYFPFDGLLESTRDLKPSFSRNSVAYLSDGTQVAANVPRFETGKFGQAVMVEEGTTNVFGNSGRLDTDSNGDGLADNVIRYTLISSYSMVTDSWLGTKSQRAVSSGSGAPRLQYNIAQAVSAGQVWSVSIHGKAQAGKTLYLIVKDQTDNSFAGSIKTQPATGGWDLITLTFTIPSGVTSIKVQFGLSNAVAGDWFQYCALQLEQKPYPTSFIDGTRSPETLTIPTAGVLNPQEGTVEFRVYVNNAVKDASSNRYLLAATSDIGYFTLRHTIGNLWQFWLADGASKNVSVADTLNIGWHQFVIRWSAASLDLFIDGTKVATTTNPTLPTGLGSALYIGSFVNGSMSASTLYDDLRISSRARTDEEILAAYQSGLPFLDIYATNQAIKSGVSYNNVEISPTVGVRATHATGEYTQLDGEGLRHFYPNPIYTETPTGVPNTEGFESGTLPSNFSGSGISVTTTAKRTGSYGLQLSLSSKSNYVRATFEVTQDNTTVSFYYMETGSSYNVFSVAVDGVTKATLNATSWTQVSITGVSKGKHELAVFFTNYNSSGTQDTYMYLDDFVFEQNPVTRTINGYSESTGYNHIYGVYIGYASSSFYIRGVGESITPRSWVQLPDYLKNKNLEVFLSLKGMEATYQVTKIHLELVEVDSSIPAFCVEGYVQESYSGVNIYSGIDFMYLIIIRD